MNPTTTPPPPSPRHRRNRLLRLFLARPRLYGAVLCGVLTYLFSPDVLDGRETSRLLLAWNVGTLLYLALAGVMMARATHSSMRHRAIQEDEGKFAVLGGVIVATVACLAAIVLELSNVKGADEALRNGRLALSALTIATAWAFIHLMFALHYAHDYYRDQSAHRGGGLQFPGEEAPDYWDFVYFAAVIGTSAQTADVSFTSRQMRRLGLLHCTLAYAFNTTLLALTINIASGLL
ncbi:DUF1345 domain-containing protein [uncultured Zoogloea sp.]|uniref:DUF1345 domain-containing protein n=1 Tax=uncultured Zoogloea sp. TaxID=160237 RepID=UPI002602B17A|nr:DUF1345 domain-containing protein [uncultured Zoogloea sp.]